MPSQRHFPDYAGAAVTNIGWLGLSMSSRRRSGYFPLRLVRPHLHSGKLALISGGPEFVLSAYVVYPVDAVPDVITPALEVIREAAALEGLSAARIG